MHEQTLLGRLALVTGGGAGIGRACALALAQEGADIAVMDLNGDSAAETVQLVLSEGRRAHAVTCDVSDYDAVKDALADIRATLGTPLLTICNAGIAGESRMFHKEQKENWKRLFEVHVDGAYHCIRETVESMREAQWGRIICISSIAATMGLRGAASYASAKAALLGLVRTLANENAPLGITANAICPGFIETAMMRDVPETALQKSLALVPMKTAGQPDDIANAVAYLCSERGRYMTGQILSPNGGVWMP